MGEFRLSGHMRATIDHKDAENRVNEFLQVVNGDREVDYWATTECSGRAEIESVDNYSFINFEVVSDEGIASVEIISLIEETLAKGISFDSHGMSGRMTAVNSIGFNLGEGPTAEVFEIGENGVILEMGITIYGYVIDYRDR